ncbi:MAG: DUF6291 domain-containing protein [Lachnospiraceae bacterium]|nr:DUF6291 domain-containing protein [Lachnospiraceae bacterium]
MERESIIFYRSWVEAIEEDMQDEKERQAVAWAILRYGIHGIEEKLTGTASAIYRLAKQTINANNRKYAEGCKGGRPKTNGSSEEITNGFSEKKPMVFQENNHRFSEEKTNGFSENETIGFSEEKPSDIQENNHRFLKNKTTDTETDTETETDTVTVRGKFIPPTLEEVKAYCEERKNTINPQRFIDFYTGKGWMIGKNKMKDWKATVRTWEETERQKPTAPATAKPNSFSQFPQRDHTDDYFSDLERRKFLEAAGKRVDDPP